MYVRTAVKQTRKPLESRDLQVRVVCCCVVTSLDRSSNPMVYKCWSYVIVVVVSKPLNEPLESCDRANSRKKITTTIHNNCEPQDPNGYGK